MSKKHILVIFCKYHDRFLDNSKRPIPFITRAFWVRWTNAASRARALGTRKGPSRGLGWGCKYLVPGMSHDVELLSWVHILQMWMLQMLSMLSARYTTDQNQEQGEFHCPNETFNCKTERLEVATPLPLELFNLNIDRSNLSLRPFHWFVCQFFHTFYFQNTFKRLSYEANTPDNCDIRL